MERLPIINWIVWYYSEYTVIVIVIVVIILLSSSYIITQKKTFACGLFDLIGKNPTCV